MGPTRSAESGQIIVVAALLLAVVFVGLALVLNIAIYTENMATRGETSTSDAMAVDAVTAERLGDALDAENYGTEEASYADRRARLAANVSAWNGLVASRRARTGQAYSIELAGVTNGTRVNQSTADYFEPANSDLLDADPLGLGSDTNWQVAVSTEVRAFEMTVRRDSLKQVDTSLSTAIQDLLNDALTGSDVFWTQFEVSETNRMYVLDDDVNDSVTVVVTEYHDDTTEDVIGVCSADAPAGSDNVTVRITRAELEGQNGVTECPALEAVADGKQDVYYAGTDDVVGTYRFLADRPEDEFRRALHDEYDSIIDATLDTLLGGLTEDDVYADSPTDADPYTTTAIYDATVVTAYADDRLSFSRNVTYPPMAR